MKKQKRNNKGFSMVELIIVIAIMAVLTAVTAPQYLRYVERSRAASDQNTIEEFNTALNVIISDDTITLPADVYNVVISNNNAVAITATNTPANNGSLMTEVVNNLGANYISARMRARANRNGYRFVVTVPTTGNPTVAGALIP